MIENTMQPSNGFIKENKSGVNVKFNLVAIGPKINGLKKLNTTFTII
jgi:hypothetical protein